MPTPSRTDRETLLDRFRERTDRLLHEALADHDPEAPVREPLVIDPPPYFDDTFPESVGEQCETRWGGVAGAVVVDRRLSTPRMLAVERGFAPGWENPSGDHEPGETLAETALRETREETNIEAELTGLLYVRELHIDYGPPAPVPIPVAVFTAERAGGRRAVPNHRVPSGEPEIVEAEWFGPDELPEGMRDRERIREYLLES